MLYGWYSGHLSLENGLWHRLLGPLAIVVEFGTEAFDFADHALAEPGTRAQGSTSPHHHLRPPSLENARTREFSQRAAPKNQTKPLCFLPEPSNSTGGSVVVVKPHHRTAISWLDLAHPRTSPFLDSLRSATLHTSFPLNRRDLWLVRISSRSHQPSVPPATRNVPRPLQSPSCIEDYSAFGDTQASSRLQIHVSRMRSSNPAIPSHPPHIISTSELVDAFRNLRILNRVLFNILSGHPDSSSR